MSTFDFVVYTREKAKILAEVKGNIEAFNEWDKNYFTKKEKKK